MPPNETHIWSVDLDVPREEIPHLERGLSPDERTRASRFRRHLDRVRYTVAHAKLREILSAYEGIAPEALRFQWNRNGKPHLMSGDSSSRTHFSLSHSQGHALVGVTIGHPVGVDIEHIDSDAGVLSIADRVFSPREQEALRRCPLEERLTLFFKMWVCKEAYVKARGGTILDRLPSFTVAISSSNQAHLVNDVRDPNVANQWRINLIQCVTGFAAAVASTNIQGSLVSRRWLQSRGPGTHELC